MGYRQIYFRINSSYSTSGWANQAAADAFREETRRLFQKIGWTIQPGNGREFSDTAVNGQQELYLHPMNFSGVIDEDSIPELEAMLTKATTFSCTGVDRYHQYMELTDEDYWALLESRRAEITAAILERYKTRRTNLYLTGDTASHIAQQFSVRRLCDKSGNRDKAVQYVSQLVEEMIADGRLVTAMTKHGKGIRTATAKELQQRS